jgi:molecular chaperone GrpE (heat shock protein)
MWTCLAEELLHLQDGVKQSLPADGGGDRTDQLRQEIDIGCTVAGERLAHIDVKRIVPGEGEEFDPQEHVICGYIQTADEGLNGRISQLVKPGIVYGRKVLRPARVTVFRQDTQQKQESSQGDQHEER